METTFYILASVALFFYIVDKVAEWYLVWHSSWKYVFRKWFKGE